MKVPHPIHDHEPSRGGFGSRLDPAADLAVEGRRMANANFFDSHSVDKSDQLARVLKGFVDFQRLADRYRSVADQIGRPQKSGGQNHQKTLEAKLKTKPGDPVNFRNSQGAHEGSAGRHDQIGQPVAQLKNLYLL